MLRQQFSPTSKSNCNSKVARTHRTEKLDRLFTVGDSSSLFIYFLARLVFHNDLSSYSVERFPDYWPSDCFLIKLGILLGISLVPLAFSKKVFCCPTCFLFAQFWHGLLVQSTSVQFVCWAEAGCGAGI